MKKAVLLMFLCFGFCFGNTALSLEKAEFKKLETKNQVDILNKAIINDEYEKSKNHP